VSDEPNEGDGLRPTVGPPPGPTSGSASSATSAGSGVGEQDGPATGRASGIGLTLLLFGLLVVSWFVQLSFALQGGFGPPEDRLSDGGLLGGFILGAAVAIVPPVLVIILEARVHKRTPRHSIIGVVGAVVVLLIAVPINAIVVGLQAASVVSGP